MSLEDATVEEKPQEIAAPPAVSSAITVEDSETLWPTSDENCPADVGFSPAPVNDTLPLSPPENVSGIVAASELVLGEASEGVPLAPLPISAANGPDTEENGDADADVAFGAAMQDKYNATSEWVESLPFTAIEPSGNVATLLGDASTTDVPARRGKRSREGKEGAASTSDRNGEGTQRQRRAREKAAEAELHTAFQHSQRALRKQAKAMSMKDVFSRSITLPSSLPLSDVKATSTPTFPASPLFAEGGGSSSARMASGGNVFSPSSSSFRFGASPFSPSGAMSPTTPSGSSAWSPCMVGELTNQFLANVKQQRRQKFEQFVSRELTQSQALSQTRSTPNQMQHGEDGEENTAYLPGKPGDVVASNAFSAPVDELVIGDEDNEAANWMPADASLSASSHGRRMMRDTNANDDVVLLGGSSAGEEGRYTTSPSTVTSDSRKAEDQASQQQVVKSLARKHEIWKLKQRELKAQQLVDLDDRAKAKQQQQFSKVAHTKASGAVSTTTTSTANAHAADADPSQKASNQSFGSATLTTTTTTTAYQSFFRPSQISSPSSTTASRSLHKANLSADAISMIRRINSFDNTSTQRVVVFGTAAAAAKQSKEAETQ